MEPRSKADNRTDETGRRQRIHHHRRRKELGGTRLECPAFSHGQLNISLAQRISAATSIRWGNKILSTLRYYELKYIRFRTSSQKTRKSSHSLTPLGTAQSSWSFSESRFCCSRGLKAVTVPSLSRWSLLDCVSLPQLCADYSSLLHAMETILFRKLRFTRPLAGDLLYKRKHLSFNPTVILKQASGPFCR